MALDLSRERYGSKNPSNEPYVSAAEILANVKPVSAQKADSYLTKFKNDTDSFIKSVNSDLGLDTDDEEEKKRKSFNAADFFEERRRQADDLKSRREMAVQSLEANADYYNPEYYNAMAEYLSNFDTMVDDVLNSYKPSLDSREGMRAYEDEYKAAMERYAQDQNLQRQAEFAFDLVGPAANFRQMYAGYLGDESHRGVTDNWTDKERYTLGQLQMENPEEARKYATDVNNYYKNQATEEERKKIREQAVANKGKSTLAALGAGLIGGGDLLDRAAEYAARGTITSKDYVSASDYASEITGAISEDLNNQYGTLNFDPYYDFRQQMSGASTFGMDGNYSAAMGTLDTVTGMFEGKGVGDLYNLGYSVAQNVLNRFTVGAVGGEAAVLASYFMNSATSSIDNAVRKGASGDQAMAIGIITGALEAATEAVPVSELFNIGPATTFKDFLKAVGVESLEEFVGEGLNALGGEIADRFIMGDLSEFETRKRYYMEELGISEQQAKTKAIMDSVNNILYEGLSGAASGALMGGTESGFQTVGNSLRTNAHYRNANPQSLIDAAMATGEGSDAFQMAQQMQAQLDAGEKISTRDKKNLGKNVQLMQLAAEKAAAEDELRAINQTENLEQLAEIVVKKRRGEELTKKETKAISKNEAVQGLFNVARPTEASTTETQEAAPVEMPSVSDSGKARSITEDADIDVVDFASFDGKNATVKLAGGETVSYDDIMFANQQQANQFYAVRTLPGLDTESANNLLHTIQEANAGQDTTSVVGIRDAYRIGYFNLNEADLAKSDSAVLNPNLRKAIFDIGRQQAKLQAQATPKVRATNVKPSKGYRKVVLEGNIKKLNSKQTAELKVIDFVSNKFAGTAVHVYESYKGEDGNFYYKDSKGVEHNAPNGKYVNGEIWVDLNSGDKGEGMMLNTFAHEMYHHIEEWNKTQANQLAEFVAKELGIEAVDKAVADQMDKARDAGYGEDYFISQGMSEAEAHNEVYARAMSDFVADSLETMFTRGDAADAIARLYGENRTLFDKVKNFIDKWISKIKEFYSDKTISTEGELVAQLENLEELQRLFMEAMKGAGENYRAALDAEPAVAGAEMSNEESFQDSATAVHFQIRPPYADGSKAFNNFVDDLNPEARETFDLFYGFYQRSRITNTVSVSGRKVKAVNISALYLLAQDWNNMLAKEPKWAAAAKDLADFLPADVRKRMNMNADGTLNPTTMEKEFKMPSSMAQRLVDALPYETIDAEYKLGDKTVTLPQGKARQSVGGEAYRRAILDETRKMFSEGKLKPVGIGTMSKDRWGSLGFLAANGKTGASGDFTTVCPQMMFNRGCWYCYRRAAMEKGVNNKLVANNVWYTGEILRIKDSDIAALNKNGGLRIQSFGDWMPHFSAMLADVLYDAELRGLQVKIITKEPSMINYIAALRDQNIGKNLYFNLSADYTIEKGPAKQAQGGDSLDTVNPERPYMRDTDNTFWWKRAMTVEEAAKYREKYDWVNTRIVATDVKEFIRGLKDNRVDVVTGYHGNIRNWERIDSSTGARKIEVEALGDAGMPRFAFNPKTGEWLTEYEGKNAVHKNLAKEIADNNLQWEYYIKTCCITGRCATCEGKCGALAKDFNTKNATNRDTESVAYWQQQMEYAVEPEFGDLTETVKFSLRGKNKDGVEVYETSTATLNMSVADRKQKYLDLMKNDYFGRTAKFTRNGHVYYARFDPKSIRKPIYGDNRTSKNGKKAVINAGADGDFFELVENSQYRGSKKNTKNHTNADYFDYYIKTVQIDGKVFDLMADVEKWYGNGGGYVYTLALVDNKKIKASPALSTAGSAPVNNAGNTSGTTVTQTSPTVNIGKHSLRSKDSTGKELTQDQQNFFEESKSRTDDGELVRVYHTSPTAGFTEFEGDKGEGFYKFGKYGDSITYFTDSKKMSSTYAKNPMMVDTKRITSLEEAKKWAADVSGGYIDIVKSNGAYRVVYSNADSEILSYKSLTDLFRNLKKDLNTELVGKKRSGMYEGYTNIKNPYVIDANGSMWNDIPIVVSTKKESLSSFSDKVRSLSSAEVDFLKKIYNDALTESNDEKSVALDKFIHYLLFSRDAARSTVWKKTFDNERTDLRLQQYQYMFDVVGNDFDFSSIPTEVDVEKTEKVSTNDIVKKALEDGSYDGVIIKNVVDYAGFGLSADEKANYSELEPNNLYVTFNSNQFKAADNLHPTDDKDMRYSLRDKRKPLTDREILAQIDPEKRNETERYFLELYQDRLKQISQEEPKLAEIKAQMEALDPVKDKAKLADLGVEARKIQRNITSLKKKVREAESIEMFKRMVSEERGNQKVQKYKEEQKQKIKDMQEEQRVLRNELTGTVAMVNSMEDEFVKLAKDLEAKKIDIKTMEEKYLDSAKKYGKDMAMWEREFNRLIGVYDSLSGKYKNAQNKIEKLEATILRQRQTAKDRVAGRKRTEMIHKIQRKVNDLNNILLHGTKHRNVPEGMQAAVASILDAINMETKDIIQRVDTYEATLKRYTEKIARATSEAEVEKLIEQRNRYAAKGDQFGNKMAELKAAYEQIQKDNIQELEMDAGIYEHLMTLFVLVGDTPLGKMNAEQLNAVNDVLNITTATIRNANKMFQETQRAGVEENGKTAKMEIRSVGGDAKKRTESMEKIEQFGWNNLKPVQAFEVIGSSVLNRLFKNLRSGEDTLAVDLQEGKNFFKNQWKKHNGDSWDTEKKWKFTSTSGKSFELDLNQIMSLYALAKRDQARDHLRVGGFTFDSQYKVKDEVKFGPVKIKAEVKNTDASAYNLSDEILGEIIGKLTADQRAFVDSMQDYLSDNMAAKGNEISLKKYGIRLFKDKNYFPLRVADQYMAKVREQQSGDRKLKNSGFTQAVTPNAKNPVVLSSFLEVWAEHVDEMSLYHSFVLPLDDLSRVLNYHDAYTEETAAGSVIEAIKTAYGEAAVNYIDNLIRDVNGGNRSDSAANFVNKWMSKAKKAQTMASLSVAIQQPSSILRAMSMINSSYFFGAKVTEKTHDRTWDEIKEYAPIAIIKEMGGYDTHVGKNTVDYLTDTTDYHGFGEKFKAFFTDGDFRDDAFGKLPELMDEMAWGVIWNAVKREQATKHPDVDVKSKAFMSLVADRFTDVITHTQVYDSVFSRSGLMRSKDGLVKMGTSFMAEPTTTANMLAMAVIQAKRGEISKAQAGRTVAAIAASLALNAALVSVVYALRDDDEDKRYDEKWLENFRNNFFESLNPAIYIPFIRDIDSMRKGFDIERTDMSLIGDLMNAIQGLGDDDVSALDKTLTVIGAVGDLLGVPMKNIIRDTKGLIQTAGFALDDRKNPATKTGYYMAISGKDLNNGEEMILALQRGDMEHIQRVYGRYESQEEAERALQSAIGEKYRNGEMTEEEATGMLTDYFDREDENEVYWLLDKWDYAIENGTSDGYTKMGALFDAIETGGDVASAMQRYLDHGSEMSDIRSEISKKYKKQYIAADEAGREEIRNKLTTVFQDTGLYKNEIQQKFKDWDFEAEYDMSFAEYKAAFRDGEVTENELTKAMKFYGLKQYEIDDSIRDLKKDISFRNKYNMSLTEMKDAYDNGDVAKNTMKQALVYSGMTANEAQDWIKKRDISNRYGIDYMELDDAYKAGDITRSQLYNAMIEAGSTKREADEEIQGYDWLKKNYKKYPDLAIGDARKFVIKISDNDEDHTLADYGVTIDHYLEYAKRKPECKGVDANGDGKTDDGTLRDSIFAMIDSLPISDQEKDGLALISYGAKSIRINAPWHKK